MKVQWSKEFQDVFLDFIDRIENPTEPLEKCPLCNFLDDKYDLLSCSCVAKNNDSIIDICPLYSIKTHEGCTYLLESLRDKYKYVFPKNALSIIYVRKLLTTPENNIKENNFYLISLNLTKKSLPEMKKIVLKLLKTKAKKWKELK